MRAPLLSRPSTLSLPGVIGKFEPEGGFLMLHATEIELEVFIESDVFNGGKV